MIDEVFNWVERMADKYQAQTPVLEVGSYNVNGSVRDLFGTPYVGVDMRSGPGVDVVLDMAENELEPIFNTLICVETLEHCRYPIDVLANMLRSAKPGALFLGSWPFMFDVHDFPDDYWRVTPNGFRAALEEAGFEVLEAERPWPSHSVAVARVPGESAKVSQPVVNPDGFVDDTAWAPS